LQTGTNKARLKQAGKNFILIVDDVKDMNEMRHFLQGMQQAVLTEHHLVAQ
jgi:transcription-repair coupling factor (superfamily II helicase)